MIRSNIRNVFWIKKCSHLNLTKLYTFTILQTKYNWRTPQQYSYDQIKVKKTLRKKSILWRLSHRLETSFYYVFSFNHVSNQKYLPSYYTNNENIKRCCKLDIWIVSNQLHIYVYTLGWGYFVRPVYPLTFYFLFKIIVTNT